MVPVTAFAQWSDDFDLYVPGPLTPQSNWEIWHSGGSDATVSTAYSISSPNSAMISALTDVVHQFSGYTSGKWTFEAWGYIPSTLVGDTWFIMCNTYPATSWPHWSVETTFSSADNLLHGKCGSSADVTVPFKYDTWNQMLTFINLDDDWVQVFCNGLLLDDPALPDHPTLGGGYAWTANPTGSGGGVLNIAVVDLYADTGTEAYWDNLTLDVMMPWLDTKCNGEDAAVTVPSGTNAKIDFSLVAGIGTGFAVDIWIVLRAPSGVYTYDGNGPLFGWNKGLNNAYSTGPLGNAFGTALDNAIPKGSYTAYIAIDTKANGRLDMGSIYSYDSVDFRVQ